MAIQSKSSLLGMIFEAGFKLGFLRKCIQYMHGKIQFNLPPTQVMYEILNNIKVYKNEFDIIGEMVDSLDFSLLMDPKFQDFQKFQELQKTQEFEEFKKELNNKLLHYIPKPLAKKYESSFSYRLTNLMREKLNNNLFTLNDHQIHCASAYAIGTWEGYLFAESIIGREEYVSSLDFHYFSIKSESYIKGSPQNMDIGFTIGKKVRNKKGELEDIYVTHIYDLKFRLGEYFVKKLTTNGRQKEEEIVLPGAITGYPISFSCGDNNLLTFLRAFKSQIESDKDSILLEVSFDLKALLQVFTYLLGYLYNANENYLKKVKQISTGYISAVMDGVIYVFETDFDKKIDKNEIKELLTTFQNFYDKAIVKTKKSGEVLTAIQYTDKDFLKRSIAEVKQKIKPYEGKILARHGTKEKIKICNPIEEIRKNVFNTVRNFWLEFIKGNKENKNKALVLLHSTGAGKTTSARRNILEQTEFPVIYLYFSPRKKLIEQEKMEAEKLDHVDVIDPYLIKSDIKKGRDDTVIVVGASQQSGSKEYGILKILQSELQNILNKNCSSKEEHKIYNNDIKVNSAASFMSTQSITQTQTSDMLGQGHPNETFDSLRSALAQVCEKYKVVIIIDELTGSDNGFYSLKTILDFMSEMNNIKPGSFALLVFDATLHSANAFIKAFEEFNKNNGFLPPSLSIVDFEEEGKYVYKGIEIDIKSGYSYPAKDIEVSEYFVFEKASRSRKENIYKEIARLLYENYLEPMKEENQRMYIYIQNKNAIKILGKFLGEYKIKYKFFTGDMRGNKKAIKQWGNYQVVLSTSTLSRGVTLDQNFVKVAVINENYISPETNLAEENQAYARIRGTIDNNGEKIDHIATKEIIKIYVIKDAIKQEDFKLRVLSIIDMIEENSENGKTNIDSEFIDLYKELVKNEYVLDTLQAVYSYANISKYVMRSYINPYSIMEEKGINKVVIPFPTQLKPLFKPSQEEKISNLISSLNGIPKFLFSEKDIEFLGCIENYLSDLFYMSSEFIFDVNAGTNTMHTAKNNKYVTAKKFNPPYMLINCEIMSAKNQKIKNEISKMMADEMFNKIVKKIAKDINPDTADGLKDLKEVIDRNKITYDCIIYIPALAILYDVVDYSFESINIKTQRYITRSFIPTAFRNITGGNQKLKMKRIISGENNRGVKTICFPVAIQDSTNWMHNHHPKVHSTLFERMLGANVD